MRYLIAALFLVFTLCLQGQAQTPTKVTIPEGTTLRVKSLNEVSSRTAGDGDLIEFTVFEDLQINGKTGLKEGTIAQGYVEAAEKARSLGKQGTLNIQFSSTKAVDGTKVPLRATRSGLEGDSKTGTSVALAVVVTPLFLFKKGKEAKLPAGKLVEAYVARDVVVSVN